MSSIQEIRLQNLKRNQEMMEDLGIEPEPVKAKAVKKKAPVKRVKVEAGPVVVRQSSRLKATELTPEGMAEKKKFDKEEDIRRQNEYDEKELLKHAAKKVRIVASKTSGTPEQLVKAFSRLTTFSNAVPSSSKASTSTKPLSKSKGKAVKVEQMESTPIIENPNLISTKAIASLKSSLSKLELRGNIIKHTPERSYIMLAHPIEEKTIVFSGDKTGHIGMAVWNEGAADPTTFSWEANGTHSVTMLKLDPINQENLYSSGYDCAVKKLNFETNQTSEIVDMGIFKEGQILISSMDIDPTGRSIWLSDNSGGISTRDVREAKGKTRRFDINDGKKVGSISVNPVNPNLLLTGHLNREMRIYDVRKLLGDKADSEDSMIVSYDYSKACSSAYFDRTGSRILSTCYDDQLRLFKSDDTFASANSSETFQPYKAIKHNNQTGRWLTVLKAQWAQQVDVSPHFTIGGLDGRTLDIFSGVTGEKLAGLVSSEETTACPATTTSHPTLLNQYFGSTASGKTSFFSTPLNPEDNEDEEEEEEEEDSKDGIVKEEEE